ncbi:MAG: hypothetical protein CMN28_16690 [Salinisphaeraceae bacterium]|nr:hypothetical protein [Salinisphaeraceae bacterium]
MAIQSLGIGSGLDVNGIVSQLVAVERAPVQNRLNRKEINIQADMSALGSMKNALEELEAAVGKINTASLYEGRSASVADSDWFSASASSGAALGAVEVEVESLAQSHRLQSAAFASADTVVGTGTLTFSLNGTSFSLDLDAENNTLEGIRDAINSADDNVGISASLITGDEGPRLVLTADETGADNAITVTAAGGDGGLDQLVYDPGTLTNLTQVREALDAVAYIDGVQVSSSNNVIDGAIEGVTLTLKQAMPNETTTLTVARDAGSVTSAMSGFVKAYNTVIEVLGKVSAANPDGQSGALVGDPLPRGIENSLRSVVGGLIGGEIGSLADLGFSTDVGGKLSFDTGSFNTAIQDDPDGIAAVFSGEGSLSEELETLLDGLVGVGGQIQARTDGLNTRLERIDDGRVRLANRLEDIEARLLKQFSAMDALVSQLQSTGSFLTQQLANINNITNPSSRK